MRSTVDVLLLDFQVDPLSCLVHDILYRLTWHVISCHFYAYYYYRVTFLMWHIALNYSILNNFMNISGGRNELVVTHSSQSGHQNHPGHQNHGTSHVGIHRSQMMDTSYNSYGAHTVPVVTSLSSPHSHPPNHPSSRPGR